MKQFITLLTLISAIMTAHAAAPQLIGRRGCDRGVENSIEAFRAGAARGYDMMECHVRVTADSVYVAAHDGKTSRLGGNLKIASSTLADLLGETYTQTIDSVTYHGRLLTIADYLAFCDTAGVTPLLHLKTMGKGEADITPLPALAELVNSAVPKRNCVILTSSQPYAQYFLDNHPEIKVVFQADAKWAELMPWIIERRLDVDIKADCLTPECIAAFHDAGLKVMTWTVNTPAEYQRLAAMGVDQMITDCLIP